MKGCPLNKFKPCDPGKCLFFLNYGHDHAGCIFFLHYLQSFSNAGNFLRLLELLSSSGLPVPSEFESPDELEEEPLPLKEYVDRLLLRLTKLQNLLKDVP